MKIRMTETYLLEADSIEELEEMYAYDDLDFAYSYREFETVKFEEVKEHEMVTIPLTQFTELLDKAMRFDILKKKAAESYTTDYEKAIFGFEMKEPPKGTLAGGEVDA